MKTPQLSVIVPVYNGARFLAPCLESLAASELSGHECIVVDDGSTDDSVRVAGEHGATVVRLEQRGGPARARNRGAETAQGDILVFLDADVCVHPDTLARVAAHFENDPAVGAVIGSYDDHPADPGFISQYKNLFHHYVHQTSRTEAWTFWAGCGAIRRPAFEAMRGFDESYTRPCVEDIELGFRLRAAGSRIDLNPAIQVTHLKRWTFWSLLRTDVFDRGVPWFLLMLRTRTMPPDLNVTIAHRLSVVLVLALLLFPCAIVAAHLAAVRLPGGSLAPALTALLMVGIAGLLLALNSDLYRFFARQRGLRFAARVVPLHWLYYAYCGVAVLLGVLVHLWDRRPSRGQAWRLVARG